MSGWIERNRLVIVSGLVLLLSLGWVGLQRLAPSASPAAEARCQALPPLRSAEQQAPSGEQATQWYQQRLKRCPEDQQAYSQLGAIYLQRARETGDPSYYQKAEGVIDQALQRQPEDASALNLQAALALGRHEFKRALELGQRALALNPRRAQHYAVVGDAQIELGQYDQAIQTIQQMVDLRPDLSSYTRVSYLRELHGDLPGAILAMQQAADSGGPTLEHSAWTRVQLGHLYFNTGALSDAQREYNHALAMLPDYIHAQAGLARIGAVRGQLDQARSLYAKVVERAPLFEYVVALGELELAAGNQAEAQRQFDLARTIDTLNQANGMLTDVEMAQFLADHGAAAQAVERARRGYAERPSIYSSATLAWSLSQAGQQQEARALIDQALRLGTRDALLLYHAGTIAYRGGDYAQAERWLLEALQLNPFFSVLYADTARETLASMRG